MSDEIPSDLVDRMMVKCARRCCICRRYRPTKLQVHHIVERGQGGGNEESGTRPRPTSRDRAVSTMSPMRMNQARGPIRRSSRT